MSCCKHKDHKKAPKSATNNQWTEKHTCCKHGKHAEKTEFSNEWTSTNCKK